MCVTLKVFVVRANVFANFVPIIIGTKFGEDISLECI